MSKTLPQLLTRLTARIGTENTTRFTDDIKTEALNRARERIIKQYPLEEFLKETTISFTSGVGTLPSDYLKTWGEVYKFNPRTLWNATTDEEYERVSYANFDNEKDLTWTIKGSSIYIYEADTVDLKFRYIYLPDDMTGSAESGFPELLIEPLILYTVRQIYFDDQNFELSQVMEQEANSLMAKHMAEKQKEYGQRIKSDIEHTLDYFGGNPII